MKNLVLYSSLLAALLPLNGFALVAHAASELPRTPAEPNWYATYPETATFWDFNYFSFFDINGTLRLNVAYITNPPEIDDQNMYVDVPTGEEWNQYPSTWDTVNDRQGNYIGRYNITDPGCIGPGYPHAFECGDNYSYVAPSNWNNCPVTVYHQWSVEDNGIGLGSGYWKHSTSAC